jgi:hypothetical protein
VAGAFAGSPTGWLAAAALAATALPAAGVARRYGWGAWPAALVPLAAPLPAVAIAWSMALALARGGIRWRDTFYPIRELRAAADALAKGKR